MRSSERVVHAGSRRTRALRRSGKLMHTSWGCAIDGTQRRAKGPHTDLQVMLSDDGGEDEGAKGRRTKDEEEEEEEGGKPRLWNRNFMFRFRMWSVVVNVWGEAASCGEGGVDSRRLPRRRGGFYISSVSRPPRQQYSKAKMEGEVCMKAPFSRRRCLRPRARARRPPRTSRRSRARCSCRCTSYGLANTPLAEPR